MDKRVAQIVAAVAEAGGKTYEVGGAVRDRLLGLESKDTDLLVTGISPEVLPKILPGRVELVGQSFGVFKVTIDGETIDVALPRTERSTGDGHRDFEITCDPGLPVEKDLARRDFSMNAIAVELPSGEFVDPFMGRSAILHWKEIEAVGDATERFREDPLRMLRAVRFVAKLGFKIGRVTADAIRDNAWRLDTVAPERVAEELTRLLSAPNPEFVGKALRAARNLGVLAKILPEFEASFGFEQKNPYHAFTVDEHVFVAIEHAVRRGASPRARLAVLLHDIAKPATFTVDEKGHGHFYKHEEVGAQMVETILGRLKFSVEDTRAVTTLVREHLRPSFDPSDKVLRRYVADLGALTEDAITCREADMAAHAHYTPESAQALMDAVRVKVTALSEISGFTQANLALRGDEIATAFGVQGKAIGQMKKAAMQAVIDGEIPNEREAILGFLRATPE